MILINGNNSMMLQRVLRSLSVLVDAREQRPNRWEQS